MENQGHGKQRSQQPAQAHEKQVSGLEWAQHSRGSSMWASESGRSGLVSYLFCDLTEVPHFSEPQFPPL